MTAMTSRQPVVSNATVLTEDVWARRCHRLIRDDRDDVLAAVREALAGADMLVASGGISMGGEHGAIKAALRDLGTVSFGKVAMQPGRPQGFGTAGPEGTPIVTLPGNPVSAFVSFRLLVAPAVRALQGPRPETPRRAVLTAPLARSNALIVVPEQVTALAAGAAVEVLGMQS